MTPGFAKPRSELPWLPYGKCNRVIINQHNFGGWTPARLSLALWLDGADASTLYDATSGGSLVAADGTVARWEDKSGNARHATQSTSGSRPQRKVAYEGGVDSLLFDGSADSMALTADLDISTHTVICVAKNTATITTATTAQTILAGGSWVSPSTTTSDWLLGAGSTTGSIANERLTNLALANNGSNVVAIYGRGKTNANVSTAMIIASQYSPGGTFVGRLNGADDYATATTPGTFASSNTRYPTAMRSIGNRQSTGGSFWNGSISEIIIVQSVLSASDIERCEGYLAHKRGMTANLPAGHPYKTVAP